MEADSRQDEYCIDLASEARIYILLETKCVFIPDITPVCEECSVHSYSLKTRITSQLWLARHRLIT